MTPATIIREAQTDGVRLALSPAGTIRATGDGAAVNRWLAVIRERKAEIIDALKVSPSDTLIASSWWLIYYPDRDQVEVACCPDATHDEILRAYPDAVAAEPIATWSPQALEPMSAEVEAAIRTWLALIGESNPTEVSRLAALFRCDPEARKWVMHMLSKMASDRLGPRQDGCRHPFPTSPFTVGWETPEKFSSCIGKCALTYAAT
jgi:hypothetical protein